MPPASFLVLSATLLALASVLAKGLLGGALGDLQPAAPLPFLVCQLAGSLALLAALAARDGEGFAVGPAAPVLHGAGIVLGLGAIGTILALAFMPVGEASVVFAMQPVVILLLARVLLSERPTMRAFVLSLLAVSGVVTILWGASEENATNRTLGVLFATISTVGAAAYVVWMRQVSGGTRPIAALIRVQGIAFAVAVLVWIGALVLGRPEAAPPPPGSAFAAAGTGAIYYGLAFYVYLLGLAHMEAGRAGNYLNLVPVFTIALAFALLGERLTITQWIGSGIVLVAVVALGRTARARGKVGASADAEA
jgi:drug/metabolite transporter (DMT)-like permease